MSHKLIIALLILFFVTFLITGCRRSQAPALVNRMVYETAAVANLRLDYDADSIYLLPSDNDKIILNEYMNENKKPYYGKAQQRKGELFITEGKRPRRTDFQSYIELYIPDSYEGSLALHSTSGIIKTDNPFVFRGDFKADTTSGGIELSQIEAADITLTSTSGPISVGELTAGTILINTTSSDTSAASLNGSIVYESKSSSFHGAEISGSGDFTASGDGNIEAVFRKLGGNMNCFAKNGNVKITLPEEASFSFSAKTKNGKVRTAFDDRLTEHEGIVSKGNDSGAAVDIETRNGDVDVLLR